MSDLLARAREAAKRLTERAAMYAATKPGQADVAALLSALSTVPDAVAGERETWASINQWCDDTFGKATIPQIIKRAKEEFEELEEDGANHAIEAADVVICLCRIPGFADALQAKMAINRKRKWRITGEGTGYHIPEEPAAPANAAPPAAIRKEPTYDAVAGERERCARIAEKIESGYFKGEPWEDGQIAAAIRKEPASS